MLDKRFYSFLHRQIPVIVLLSLVPGLAYLLLGWLHGIVTPALVWYLLVVVQSCWGYRLYRTFSYDTMSNNQRNRWYRQTSWFFYSFYLLWVLIFLLYVKHNAYKLHYIAIFTEIGAAAVAASTLASDRRLFKPTVLVLMIPLIIYFALIGAWYGYILSVFAAILAWVLLYTAGNTSQLLLQAHHQATHDALTGLYNRHYFIEHLQNRLNSLSEGCGCSYLLLIDLDHFKTVNDSLGHDIGDRLLQTIATRLQQQLPTGSFLARLGGDEFIVTGCSFSDREKCTREALQLAEQLLTTLKETYQVDLHHLYISASIGVSIISGQGASATRFIKEADIAMYEVKATGRDGVFIFNEEMAERVERQLEIERLLHFALTNNEITLHYQPQIGHDERVVGVEALARWHSPQLGAVPPDRFISVAEKTGLIIELGKQILDTAFRTLRAWRDQGITLEQFSINISMRQFTHHSFVEQVEQLLQTHLDTDLRQTVIFEVTESLVAEDITRVITTMTRLRQSGIRFSMDDFGTGYSSLNYLNRLPIDEIKIDRSFVGALDRDQGDRAMVTTIIKMAELYDLCVVAEGVETIDQYQFLHQQGCQLFQGYFYAPAMPDQQFLAYYRSHQDRLNQPSAPP